MKDWYTFALVGTFGLLVWSNLTGRAPSDSDVVRDVPANVRNNPGSYRSHYSAHYVRIGGK